MDLLHRGNVKRRKGGGGGLCSPEIPKKALFEVLGSAYRCQWRLSAVEQKV